MVKRRPDLDLHIEELILRGLPAGTREGLGEAIREELQRLIAEHGMPAALNGNGGPIHLPGGSFQVDPRSKTGSAGAQVARALHRSWTETKS